MVLIPVKNAQKWEMTEDGFIKNKLFDKCIDVYGNPGTKNGTRLKLYDCELEGETSSGKETDQKWEMTEDGFIKNKLSDKCIDVYGNPRTNKITQLILGDCKTSVFRLFLNN